jgi:hypothetical protein
LNDDFQNSDGQDSLWEHGMQPIDKHPYLATDDKGSELGIAVPLTSNGGNLI